MVVGCKELLQALETVSRETLLQKREEFVFIQVTHLLRTNPSIPRNALPRGVSIDNTLTTSLFLMLMMVLVVLRGILLVVLVLVVSWVLAPTPGITSTAGVLMLLVVLRVNPVPGLMVMLEMLLVLLLMG